MLGKVQLKLSCCLIYHCRISELRAVELLDGICDQMKNYIYATFTISASDKTTQQWDKWMGKDATAMINSTRWVTGSCGSLWRVLSAVTMRWWLTWGLCAHRVEVAALGCGVEQAGTA